MRSLAARIFLPLMLAIYFAMLKPAFAGCGCDKPPPLPAAVIPAVAFTGMPVTFFDPRFVPGQVWSATFSSGPTSATVSAPVVLRRDITDKTGAKLTPQLVVQVPALPPGPCSIQMSDATGFATGVPSSIKPPDLSSILPSTSKMFSRRKARSKKKLLSAETLSAPSASTITIPADSFVVIGRPVPVTQQDAEYELDPYTTAVGTDNTLYVAVGGLNQVCDAMSFQAVLKDYALRFSNGDVLIFNSQGYFIDSLTPQSHNHFSIGPAGDSASNPLFYARHSFAKYCLDHRVGGAKQVDPKDPNWHLDGTPHVDYANIIFAITGRLDDGSTPQPGAISAQLKLESSVADGSEGWETELPEEDGD